MFYVIVYFQKGLDNSRQVKSLKKRTKLLRFERYVSSEPITFAIICYGLEPSEGTWVLSITHGTWQSSFGGKKGSGHFGNHSDKN